MVFHLSVFLSVFSNVLLVRKHLDIDCKQMILSPECVLKGVFKLYATEKVLGHYLQGNGFSPECILNFFINDPPYEKAFRTLIARKCFFT